MIERAIAVPQQCGLGIERHSHHSAASSGCQFRDLFGHAPATALDRPRARAARKSWSAAACLARSRAGLKFTAREASFARWNATVEVPSNGTDEVTPRLCRFWSRLSWMTAATRRKARASIAGSQSAGVDASSIGAARSGGASPRRRFWPP